MSSTFKENAFHHLFSLEFWIQIYNFKNQNSKLLATSSFEISIKKNEIIFTNDSQIYNQQFSPDIEEGKWQHMAITYDEQNNKLFTFYLNCNAIAKVNMKNTFKKMRETKLFEIDGKVTEIRLWKCCLNQKLIYSNFKSVLSILAEKKHKLSININSKGTKPLSNLSIPGKTNLPKPGGFKAPQKIQSKQNIV